MSTAFNVWTPEGNVLPNTANTWANPNVLYDANPIILTGNTHVFKMWVSASLGTHGIYYFESVDGLTNWTAYASNPVISNQILPKIFKNGGTYYLYTDNLSETEINAYTSTDGVTWISQGTVISPGSAGQWDADLVFQLAVVDIVAGTWYGYYSGTSGTGATTDFEEGLVTSPDGLTWTKAAGNPVFRGGGNPTFHKVNGIYYAWTPASYTGITLKDAGGSTHVDIGRWSSPAVTGPWTKLQYAGKDIATYYAAIPADLLATPGEWAGNQIGDPSIVDPGNGNTYIYYTLSYNGGAIGVNGAIATGSTMAQLVQTYEGVVGAPLSGNPSANLTVLASDPGTGADANPIGGNWSLISTNAPYSVAQRLSNLIKGVATTAQHDSYWNALIWPNDQWAQSVISTTAVSGFVGASCRMSTSGVVTEYRVALGNVIPGNAGEWFITKLSAGTGTNLATATGFTFNVGDTMMCAVNGSNIYWYWNGILIGVAQDSAIASGSAGFELNNNSVVANAAISSWSGGSFQGAFNGISGSLGAAGAGATVTFTGSSSGTTTADGSGNYNTGEVLLPFGTYTITPTQSGVTFTPISQIVTLSGADMSGVNFTSSSGSSAFSITDSRVSPFGPNNATLVNGTETYTQTPNCSLRWWFDTSFNHTQCTPEDCRAAGAPVASGTYPQNSRVKGG